MSHPVYSQSVPSVTAVASAVGASLVQTYAPETDHVTPLMSMIIPVVAALIGGGVSYGILKGTVQSLKEQHAQQNDTVTAKLERLETGQDIITRDLTEVSKQVANIEGRIGRRRDDSHVELRD